MFSTAIHRLKKKEHVNVLPCVCMFRFELLLFIVLEAIISGGGGG